MASSSRFFDFFPIAHALRQTFKRGYGSKDFMSDCTAAIVVSLVALPLSMALSIAVGLPPQHGLYTAIVAGVIAAVLGGSMTQVSGPTAAFVVLVAPIVEQYGLRGLILTEIMAGMILIVLALARFGAYIQYVPYPVTTGFTAGIAVVLGTLSLNDFLGLGIISLNGSYIHKLTLITSRLPYLEWSEALIGFTSLGILVGWKYITQKIPSAIVAIIGSTALAWWLNQHGIEVATIGSRFSFDLPDGTTMHGIPPYPPSLHIPGLSTDSLFAFPSFEEIHQLMMPAVVIAALAALESLLSATVADGLAGTRHHPNSELLGIGIANIFTGFAAGVPATGAIARTAANIKNGARSPFASAIHAVLIMLYVLALAPMIAYVPMASLAAILLITAYHMSHFHQFMRAVRYAPRHDVLVLVVCFGLTVFVDMVAGVSVGIMLATLLFMKRVVGLTEVKLETWENQHNANHTPIKLPKGVMVYQINGPLFFGTSEKALDRSNFTRREVSTIILDISQVALLDMSGLVALESLLIHTCKKGRKVILCSNHQRIITKINEYLPASLLKKIEIVKSVEEGIKRRKTEGGRQKKEV